MDMTRITISHKGMSKEWFDAGLRRAVEGDKVATRRDDGRWSVTSASSASIRYITTTERCSCPGDAATGKCCCRCLVIFEEWLMQQPAVARPHSDEAA